MDISKVLWVILGLIVVGAGFLMTNPGADWVYERNATAPAEEDGGSYKFREATLSRYGGFLLATFRYEKAKKFYTAAINNYPAGDNRYWNRYQLARVEEKLKNWQNAVNLLYYLWEVDADQYDDRIPNQATLKARILQLVEVHELPNPYDSKSSGR